jgi:hypothetical protein
MVGLNPIYIYRYRKNTPSSELFHQVLPNGPHTCPFAVYVHRNGKEHASQLDPANSDEDFLRSVVFKPVSEE